MKEGRKFFPAFSVEAWLQLRRGTGLCSRPCWSRAGRAAYRHRGRRRVAEERDQSSPGSDGVLLWPVADWACFDVRAIR